MSQYLECGYDDGPHEFPDDWVFGGADGTHPGADARWEPTTYIYYDAQLHVVHLTSAYLCDDQAIDEFTTVTGYGPGYKPVYLAAMRPGVAKQEMIPVKYDPATDTAIDLIPA